MKPEALDNLLQRYLDGTATPEEIDRVWRLLSEDPNTAARLTQLSLVGCMLVRLGQQHILQGSEVFPALETEGKTGDVAVEPAEGLAPNPERIQEIQAQAERRLRAFLKEEEEQRRQLDRRESKRPRWTINPQRIAFAVDLWFHRTVRGVVALCFLAFVGILVAAGIQHYRFQRVVATLVDSKFVQWQTVPESNDLRPGTLTLRQGYAEIEFKRGARVLLQAPCEWTLQTPNKMYLENGAVTAKVPPSAIGFTIETLGSQVVDEGTEFGVMVNNEQQSEVHVFDGHVRMRSSLKSRAGNETEKLTGGEAITMALAGQVARGSLSERIPLFARTMPTIDSPGIPGRKLSLADIVGGGNGFGTGIIGGRIDPVTGRVYGSEVAPRPRPPESLTEYETGHWPGSGQYVPVPTLPYVDGVFVPDSQGTACVVSSSNHTCLECPDTDGLFIWRIVNGWGNPDGARVAADPNHLRKRSGISMHANLGITFDLDALRKAMPGVQILAFRGQGGLPDPETPEAAEADIWVLTNGRVRFVRERLRVGDMESIHVTLTGDDRFLTLMTTDGGKQQVPQKPPGHMDWCFFADPVLDLAPIDKPKSP